jgi:hypothetical protein
MKTTPHKHDCCSYNGDYLRQPVRPLLRDYSDHRGLLHACGDHVRVDWHRFGAIRAENVRTCNKKPHQQPDVKLPRSRSPQSRQHSTKQIRGGTRECPLYESRRATPDDCVWPTIKCGIGTSIPEAWSIWFALLFHQYHSCDTIRTLETRKRTQWKNATGSKPTPG